MNFGQLRDEESRGVFGKDKAKTEFMKYYLNNSFLKKDILILCILCSIQ